MGRFFIMVNPDELTRQEAAIRQGEAPKDGAENG